MMSLLRRRRQNRQDRRERAKRLLFEPLEHRRLLACDATPTATLVDVPAESLLGSEFSFTARFDNTSATDTGFGPYLDLYLPATGADGSTVGPPDDGITYVSGSFMGSPATPDVLTFGPDSNGNGIPDVEHPFAKDATGCCGSSMRPRVFSRAISWWSSRPRSAVSLPINRRPIFW